LSKLLHILQNSSGRFSIFRTRSKFKLRATANQRNKAVNEVLSNAKRLQMVAVLTSKLNSRSNFKFYVDN